VIASDNIFPKVLIASGAVPADPAAGMVKIYSKVDKLLYARDDAGLETRLAGLSAIADQTMLGNISGGSALPIALTATQIRTLLALATIATSGSASDLGSGTLAAARIAAGSLALSKLANMADLRVLGNNSGGAGPPLELTAAQIKALLAIANTDVSGLGTLSTQNGTFSGTSSGTNTGDQTTVSGNAGSATILQTARTIGGVSFDGSANISVPFSMVVPWAGAAMTTAGGKSPIFGSINLATAGQSFSRNVHFSRICLCFNCGAQVGTPALKVTLFKTNQSAGNELIAVTSAAVGTSTGQGPLVSTSLLNGFAGALAAGTTFIITAELVGGTSATITAVGVGLEGTYD
jgi:hypothetical protein